MCCEWIDEAELSIVVISCKPVGLTVFPGPGMGGDMGVGCAKENGGAKGGEEENQPQRVPVDHLIALRSDIAGLTGTR